MAKYQNVNIQDNTPGDGMLDVRLASVADGLSLGGSGDIKEPAFWTVSYKTSSGPYGNDGFYSSIEAYNQLFKPHKELLLTMSDDELFRYALFFCLLLGLTGSNHSIDWTDIRFRFFLMSGELIYISIPAIKFVDQSAYDAVGVTRKSTIDTNYQIIRDTWY